MAKIIKTYREEMPALTLIGKLYLECDRDENGTYAHKWAEWFGNGWFDMLKASGKKCYGDGYVGVMRMNNGVFEYRIGILAESACDIPAGFTSLEFPAGSFGVAWIQGKDDGSLYAMHDECMSALKRDGLVPADSAWYIERYVCPRFTMPDANGGVILDYMVSLEG